MNSGYTFDIFKLFSLNTKEATIYDVGNSGPDLGKAQQCGGAKPVNGILTLPSSFLFAFISSGIYIPDSGWHDNDNSCFKSYPQNKFNDTKNEKPQG